MNIESSNSNALKIDADANSAISPIPFPSDVCNNLLRFEVKKQTKFERILTRVNKELQTSTANMVFHGIGDGCEKCISFVEVLKKKSQIRLYQWNIIQNSTHSPDSTSDIQSDKKIEQFIPEIFVMMSKEPYPTEFQCSSQQTSGEMLATASPVNLPKKKLKPIRKGLLKSENKWRRPNKKHKNDPNKIVKGK